MEMKLYFFISLAAFTLTAVFPQAVSQEAASRFARAKAAEARADWQAAEGEYQKAIELAPQWAEAMVNLGVVFNKQQKAERAIEIFRRAIVVNPTLAAAR